MIRDVYVLVPVKVIFDENEDCGSNGQYRTVGAIVAPSTEQVQKIMNEGVYYSEDFTETFEDGYLRFIEILSAWSRENDEY